MLTEKDLSQIQNYMIQVLPQLLYQQPEIASSIKSLITPQLPVQNESVRILEELKLLREDTHKHFQQVEHRIEQVEHRFEQVEHRLEQVEQRMEKFEERTEQNEQRMVQFERRTEQNERQIELLREQTEQQIELLREEMIQRFAQVEQRIDQNERQIELLREEMIQRFAQVEQRIDQNEQQIKLLREEMNQRFDKVDQRFAQVDQRFDKVDQRLDKVDQRLDKVDQRLDKVDQRLDKVDQHLDKVDQRLDKQHQDSLDLKRRMIKVESTVERTNEKITQFDAWLKIIAGNLGDEKGQALEQLFALGLSYGLKNREVLPETIQLRQQFEDTEGLVYLRKGKFIEVDIIAENGQLTVFEVKASAVETDVAQFARKVKLVELQNPDKQVQGIFISPGARDEVKQCCAEYEIELLD
jgi:hypothetical protein